MSASAAWLVQGWDGLGWYRLADALTEEQAMARAEAEKTTRCDVRVVDPNGKPAARWLMGDRTIA